jgi:hypothetical protein
LAMVEVILEYFYLERNNRWNIRVRID